MNIEKVDNGSDLNSLGKKLGQVRSKRTAQN